MKLFVICLLCLLVPAAAAQAAVTVTYSSSGGLRVEGGGAPDRINITEPSPGTYRVSDQGGTAVNSGSGCSDGIGNLVNSECAVTGNRIITIDFGGGDDTLNNASFPLGDMFVRGEAGNDRLQSAGGFDALDGGPGNDILNGLGGDDLMEGGDGNDLFAGDTPGTNTLRGGAGNDTMSAQIDQAASADRFDGGPGRDTANYENRTERVRVSITNSSPPNDGKDGEGDDLDNVETYIGGSGNDDMRAFDFVNARSVDLVGNAGNDLLLVDGDVLGDLDGGTGADTYDMKGRSHAALARDGEKDTFICSAATELITADLRDPPFPVNCATVAVGAVDEKPNVRFRSKRAALREGGRLSVKLHCPRQNTEPCAGTLEARLDRRGTAFGSGADYSIRPGRSATVGTRLRGGQRRGALRRRARVRLQSIETGLHGAKTTTTSLRVRVLTRSGG